MGATNLKINQTNIEHIEIDIDKSRNHLKTLHSDSKGYITVAKKNPNYIQWHYKSDDLINRTDEIISSINTYVSQNTFYKPQRRIENIKELRAVYIDIDCHKTKYTKDAVQYFLENDLYGYKIPRPNYLIDSGRGLYYVILIKPVPSMAMPLWYAVQRYLYNALKEFGADSSALDPARVLRIVGTINSKSNTCVKVIDAYEYEYELREIQENYLPEVGTKREPKKGRPKKIVSLFNEYSLYYARTMDIIKICELRNYSVTGHRELILFLYRYFTSCFTEDEQEGLERALELNANFTEPLPEKEVITDTNSATKAYKTRLYKYTNAKLIELLDITDKEQEHLKSIISTKEKYARKNKSKKIKRRNKNGLTKKQQEKQDLKKKIEQLKSEGLSLRNISKKLDISLGKIQRILG